MHTKRVVDKSSVMSAVRLSKTAAVVDPSWPKGGANAKELLLSVWPLALESEPRLDIDG